MRSHHHLPQESPRTLYFAPNYSMFMVPYMQDRNHRIPEDAEANHNTPRSVRLSRDVLRRTAACSVARFGILATSVTAICAIRIALLHLLMENRPRRYILCIGEIGRWIIILSQESSVLTYSCAYKCVTTWASPIRFGRRWDCDEQELFRREVLQSMGCAYQARILLWLAELVFTSMGLLSSWWRSRFGPSIFSCFNSPNDEAFSTENIETVQLRVSEQGDLSPAWIELYEINFVAPKILMERATHRLYGYPKILKPMALVLVIPAVCAIIGPTTLLGDGEAMLATFLFSLMQFVASMVVYRDFPDKSINCAFDDAARNPIPPTNVNHSAATPNRHTPVPSSSDVELTQIDAGLNPGHTTVHEANEQRRSPHAKRALPNDQHIGADQDYDRRTSVAPTRVGTDLQMRSRTMSDHRNSNDGSGSRQLRRQNRHAPPLLARSATWPQYPAGHLGRYDGSCRALDA
jgi:hypothetical protein